METWRHELYHHGIMGMKWGVRRYQNKDGTLTALGRRRYFTKDAQLTKEGREALTDGNGALSDRGMALINAHTKVTDTNNTEVANYFKEKKELFIKKGEQFVRYAQLDEPIDNKRKYVSYGKELAERYMEFASEGMLGFDGNSYAKYTYTSKKDMRLGVFTPQDIIDNYLAPSKADKQKAELSNREGTYTTSQRFKQRELLYVERCIARSRDYIDSLYSKEIERIKPDLKKKGYDAVLDWNDVNLSVAEDGRLEFPLVILDPKESIKLSKYDEEPWNI